MYYKCDIFHLNTEITHWTDYMNSMQIIKQANLENAN